MWNPNPNPNDENSNIVMKYHFYIFNDKTNDKALYNIVYSYIGRIQWMVGLGPNIIGFGLMKMPPNSKAKFFFTLWVVTLT
jgi:hypothetical protein